METDTTIKSESNHPAPTRQRDAVAIYMSTLAMAEDAGNWGVVFNLLRTRGAWLEGICTERGDEGALSEISRLRKKLVQARAHERVHGAGSLELREHPLNAMLTKCHDPGRQYLSTAEEYLDEGVIV